MVYLIIINMPIDKITKKNYLSTTKPYLPLYAGWYNKMVDGINEMLDQGLETTNGSMTSPKTGKMTPSMFSVVIGPLSPCA